MPATATRGAWALRCCAAYSTSEGQPAFKGQEALRPRVRRASPASTFIYAKVDVESCACPRGSRASRCWIDCDRCSPRSARPLIPYLAGLRAICAVAHLAYAGSTRHRVVPCAESVGPLLQPFGGADKRKAVAGNQGAISIPPMSAGLQWNSAGSLCVAQWGQTLLICATSRIVACCFRPSRWSAHR
jgi:hypothetical protein